jgi:hypothetical protein
MDSKDYLLKNHIPIPFNIATNLTMNLGFRKGKRISSQWKLSRFDNSQNVKMSLPEHQPYYFHVSGIPETWK